MNNISLRHLCIQNNWFTAGTATQYEKLFSENDAGASPDELASIIWLCSDGVTKYEILNAIAAEEENTDYPCFIDEDVSKLIALIECQQKHFHEAEKYKDEIIKITRNAGLLDDDAWSGEMVDLINSDLIEKYLEERKKQ